MFYTSELLVKAAITKDLEWAKKNALYIGDISKIIYKKNSFLPYEEVV